MTSPTGQGPVAWEHVPATCGEVGAPRRRCGVGETRVHTARRGRRHHSREIYTYTGAPGTGPEPAEAPLPPEDLEVEANADEGDDGPEDEDEEAEDELVGE